MLENGFGEHNIQGIGDKHIPLIHNVMNTDIVVGISDRATDQLNVLFNTRRRPRPTWLAAACAPRASSALSTRSASRASATSSPRSRWPSTPASAPTTSIVTVATDGAAMYAHRARQGSSARDFPGGFDASRRRRPSARAPAWAPATDHAARADRGRSATDLQPRLLHLGRAAGRPARRVRGAPRPGFWRELRAIAAGLGRDDRGVQRARRRRWPGDDRCCAAVAPAGGRDGAADRVRLRRLRVSRSPPTTVVAALPARRPGDDIDHVLRRVSTPRASAGRPGTEAEPVRPLPDAASTPTTWPGPQAGPTPLRRLVERARRRGRRRRRPRASGHAVRRARPPRRRLGLGEAGGVWVKDETGNVSRLAQGAPPHGVAARAARCAG